MTNTTQNMLGLFQGAEFMLLGVFAILIIGLFMWQSKSRRKMHEQQDQMAKSLRPGLRIKTVAGVIGRIKEVREEAPHLTTALIETGHGKEISYMLIDINAIMAIIDEEMLLRAKQSADATTDAEKRIEQARLDAEARIANATIVSTAEPITSTGTTKSKTSATSESLPNDPTPDFDAKEFVQKSNASRTPTKKKSPQKKS